MKLEFTGCETVQYGITHTLTALNSLSARDTLDTLEGEGKVLITGQSWFLN